jgi:hypothetical protein
MVVVAQDARRTVGGVSNVGCRAKCATYGGWGIQCRVACALGARAMVDVAQDARRTVGGVSNVGCRAKCATYGGGGQCRDGCCRAGCATYGGGVFDVAMVDVAQDARRTVGGMSDVGCRAGCATYVGY